MHAHYAGPRQWRDAGLALAPHPLAGWDRPLLVGLPAGADVEVASSTELPTDSCRRWRCRVCADVRAAFGGVLRGALLVVELEAQ